MQKRALETFLYSAGGVIALAAILIAANFLLSAFNARVDLTQGNVYTLSPGTKAILAKLEAPVKIRLYYSQGSNTVPVALKTFAKRVEDLLTEYRAASGGKVVVEKFNPEPDSDAEDSATLDGIDGQTTDTGEKFYLGLSVSFLDQKAAIPVLAPDRERLLEYQHHARDLAGVHRQETGGRRDESAAGARALAQPDAQATADRAVGARLGVEAGVRCAQGRDGRRQDR